MSQHAVALQALAASLLLALTLPHRLVRASGTPETIPQDGALVTLHKGGCDAAEPMLSPLRYEIIWATLITVDADTEAARDAAIDAVAARLLADPTLSSVVDWAEMAMPETEVSSSPALDGMGQQPPIFAATLPVRLHYVADSPAG
jgi:hypothetical protein